MTNGESSAGAAASVDSGGGQNGIEFAGTDHGVNFRNVLLDFRPVAFHQATGNDQLLRLAGDLVLRHFQDGIRPIPAWPSR